MKKCPICGGKIINKKENYYLLGENLGKFPTMVCTKCNESFYDEDVMDQIDEVAKEKGLWGLQSETKLSEVGNSLAVRLNKKLVEFFNVNKGEKVLLYPTSRERLVMEVKRESIADKPRK